MQASLHDSPLAFIAMQAAMRAGHFLRKGFGSRFTIEVKANAQDLVTEFDRTAEKMIIDFIREQFPSHTFLAEESGASGEAQGVANNDGVRWIIDPLDGTMNFVHHIPLFAVSIAAMVGDVVEVGVIYHPMTDELFVAQRGRGAYLNGTRLQVSTISTMAQAVVCAGFPYGANDCRRQCIAQYMRLLDVGNPIRLLGSATMALSYVAAGRFDVFWGMNLQPWDMAAGSLLVEEAGGRLTHFDGCLHSIFGKTNVVATNRHLHEAMLAFLK